MKIAPLAWNLLATATVSTNAKAFERGRPASNLFDVDPLRVMTWRGRCVVSAGVDDSLAWNDGSSRTATIAAGTYYSMHEAGIAAAAAMNAVAGTWYVYLDQNAAAGFQHHMVFKKTSGTATLDPTVSTSALRLLFGFRNQTRSASGTHYGDFPAVQGRSDAILMDIGSAKSAQATFLANAHTGPGALWSVSVGDTTSVTDRTYYSGDVFDDEVTCIPYGTVERRRYVRLDLDDHWRKDRLRASLGYWYHGPWFDTELSTDNAVADYEWNSFAHELAQRSSFATSIGGQIAITEQPPRERFAVGFATAPGLPAAQVADLENLLDTLGKTELAFLAFDSANEPCRMSRLARLVETPTIQPVPGGGRDGAYAVALRFEAVETREAVL